MTQLKRLLDEPGSELDRVLLEAGLDDEPPKASLDRTLVALGVGSATAIGAGAIGASGAGASLGGAKGLFGAGIAKWVGGVLIASAAVGGGFLITKRTAEPPPREAPAAIVAPAATELVAEVDGPHGAKADEPAAQVAPAALAPREGASLDAKGQAAPPAAKLDAAPAEAAVASKVSEPKGNAPKSSSEKTAPAKAEKAKPELTAGGNELGDELRIIDSARKALLAGDPDGCLANLAKYSSKFPKGQLVSDAQATKAACVAKKAAATKP